VQLNAFCENLLAHGKQIKDVRWVVTDVQQLFESLKTNQDLPPDLPGALTAAVAAAGYSLDEFFRELYNKFGGNQRRRTSILNWLAGTSHPSAKLTASVLLVNEIEQTLNLPEGTLAVRAFKHATLLKMGNSQPIPYRVHHGRVTKSRYYLQDLPSHLIPFWNELTHWRSQPALRVYGVVHVIEAGKTWTKPSTSKKHRRSFLGMVSWLCLPPAQKPIHEMSDEELWATGKGMSPDAVTLAHILNPDLVWEYQEYRRSRQVNKTYTQETEQFIILINSLVNHDYSFVKAHEELAPVFGQTCKGAAWVQFVEDNYHQPILKLNKVIKKGVSKDRQRHPDAPLKSIIADANPMVYLLEMADQMEANLAPASHRQIFAAQLRDIAMIRMLIEVPIRSENIKALTLGRHMTKDQDTGLWALFIPKGELKNKHSPHAFDIDRVYSEKTSSAIDRYLTDGRTKLYGNERTNLVFLSGASGPRRKGDLKKDLSTFSDMDAQAIWWALSKRLKAYFGVGVGANIFRHLTATSILKDNPGDLEAASSVLNNSPETISENYKHLTQADGLRRAKTWRDTLAGKHEAQFGTRPNP
jgi:hypothetical protein